MAMALNEPLSRRAAETPPGLTIKRVPRALVRRDVWGSETTMNHT